MPRVMLPTAGGMGPGMWCRPVQTLPGDFSGGHGQKAALIRIKIELERKRTQEVNTSGEFCSGCDPWLWGQGRATGPAGLWQKY